MFRQLVMKRVAALTTCMAGLNLSLGVYAQERSFPQPALQVVLSPVSNSPTFKGIKVYPQNPFRFDFILDKGDGKASDQALKEESTRLIKYFLASLTTPEDELWVNLSPYEKDRIVPDNFGRTEMGRDLLEQDYLLKQLTASLLHPETAVGKEFWAKVYEETARKFKTTNIPVSTFNKVWIVPEKAVVYENAEARTAYVVESSLKVMLEEDWMMAKAQGRRSERKGPSEISQLGSRIMREIVIPALTKEVNKGKNFGRLRQAYYSFVLATWYKKKIKNSILGQVYIDKNKIIGVDIHDPEEKQKIYERYLLTFKKGVYSYIKEEPNLVTGQVIPRKYFSGGARFTSKGIRMTPQYVPFIQSKNLYRVVTEISDRAMEAGEQPQVEQRRSLKTEFISRIDVLDQGKKNGDQINQILTDIFMRIPVNSLYKERPFTEVDFIEVINHLAESWSSDFEHWYGPLNFWLSYFSRGLTFSSKTMVNSSYYLLALIRSDFDRYWPISLYTVASLSEHLAWVIERHPVEDIGRGKTDAITDLEILLDQLFILLEYYQKTKEVSAGVKSVISSGLNLYFYPYSEFEQYFQGFLDPSHLYHFVNAVLSQVRRNYHQELLGWFKQRRQDPRLLDLIEQIRRFSEDASHGSKTLGIKEPWFNLGEESTRGAAFFSLGNVLNSPDDVDTFFENRKHKTESILLTPLEQMDQVERMLPFQFVDLQETEVLLGRRLLSPEENEQRRIYYLHGLELLRKALFQDNQAIKAGDNEPWNKGGIEFSSNEMSLDIQSSGQEIEFFVDQDMLRRIQDVPGFAPVVLSLKPLGDLPKFLGVTSSP